MPIRLIMPLAFLLALGSGPEAGRVGGEQEGRFSDYAPPWPEAPDTGAMIARLFVGTVVVLAACWATLWMAKRWLRGPQTAPAASGRLQILDSINLGNRCSLQLVQADGRQVLVGSDATGLKALVALPDSFQSMLADGPETLADSNGMAAQPPQGVQG